jgi:hypothetical protein
MSFDPEQFMRQVVDAPLETEFTMVPQGEYLAAIDDFDRDAIEPIDFTYKRGPNAGSPGRMFKLTLPFIINDEAVKRELGRDKVVVTKQIILDVDDKDGLAVGTNKNIELGRIRDAVGQNKNGAPWSILDLRGAGPVMVKVAHIEFDRKDGSKGKRAEIERVVRVV